MKPVDLKDTMTGYLQNFLTRLHNVKKLCTVEKYEEHVLKVLREQTITIIESKAVEVFQLLKAIMLVRNVDRSIREKSIRGIKMLLKLCPAANAQLIESKIPVFIIFILEREFKSSVVAKERQQCFKLISAWLTLCPDTFPLLFA